MDEVIGSNRFFENLVIVGRRYRRSFWERARRCPLSGSNDSGTYLGGRFFNLSYILRYNVVDDLVGVYVVRLLREPSTREYGVSARSGVIADQMFVKRRGGELDQP